MTQASGVERGRRMEFIPSPKWVRVVFGGQVIADSKRAHLLREGGPPTYYFPMEDVRTDLLVPTEETTHSPSKGEATLFTAKAGDMVSEQAAWSYSEPTSEASWLKGYVGFVWDKMDGWFEENEEVYIHARDPHKRVDVIKSTRHVQVVVAGETVAESHNPMLLFETGMPTRYYLPRLEMRTDMLRPSDTVTRCPYKGEAHYHSVEVNGALFPDMAWYYIYTTAEAAKVAGMIAFFNERVDALYVDGELQEKPRTSWSRSGGQSQRS